ncbi:MAG: serine/threonine protein kinase, partial [Candidatus Melainabacteria bacterium]|nr:serine/threonine protein kinase [Candidatus Melainabacteria bacterium]
TVAISDDGSRIVSGSRDATVRLWDVDSGEEVKVMNGHTNWVTKVRFISVDKILSGGLDKTFRVWDVDEGREDRIYNLQNFGMWSLGFSELGDKAITGSDDFTLRVWSMKP